MPDTRSRRSPLASLPLLTLVVVSLHPVSVQAREDVAAPPKLEVIARLSRLPTAPRCRDGRPIWVATRYTIERLRSKTATLRAGSEIVVLHACPRLARGYSRHARGNAGILRPGDRHVLRLAPLLGKGPDGPARRGAGPANLIDPVPDDGLPRFRALATDAAEDLPLIVVTVEGGVGRAHKLSFGGYEVTIGSRVDSDVLLTEGDVAARHFRLLARKDTLVAVPSAGATLRVDGKIAPQGGAPITYQSKLRCGPYTLSASLLTAEALHKLGRQPTR